MQYSMQGWSANYFGVLIAIAGFAVIVTGFIISDDQGFLLILVGAAAFLGGLVGQALRRLFTS